LNETSLQNKVVLITGAARGIGRATAAAFAREGSRVALVDRDRSAVEDAAREIGDRSHALPLTADVSRRTEVDAAVQACVAAFGGIDVLVGNAGISFARAIDEYTDEEWDRILGVNLNGAFYAIRAAVPFLRQSKGSVVFVSSMTALVGQARGAAYVASKGALVSMTKALALELGESGVRVNCVCPAGVDTPLMRSWAASLPNPEAILQQQAAMHLLNRMADAQEIASAIVFLASPAAAFITGIALPIDGGATLGYRNRK
jgi:NAD(P)-dependent dehydrogenase (short-subunit alcohol dehydrogenase family)